MAILECRTENVIVIGDAEAPRKIWNAIHEGFHVAKNLL